MLTQAITGLGGIGKTQTALAYAYRHLADYDLVWWLRAETPATLAADYATLAGPLGLDPDTADQAKLTAAIRQRLQAMPGWLLVFDNVEDPALPRAWLPGTGGGHALITSRRTDWRGLARALPLELMPEDEALQLLTGRPDPAALPPAELAAAKELADELGYLPLALAQARAYMAETGKSLAGYLRLFRPAARPTSPPTHRAPTTRRATPPPGGSRSTPPRPPAPPHGRCWSCWRSSPPTRCRSRCWGPIPPPCPKACAASTRGTTPSPPCAATR